MRRPFQSQPVAHLATRVRPLALQQVALGFLLGLAACAHANARPAGVQASMPPPLSVESSPGLPEKPFPEAGEGRNPSAQGVAEMLRESGMPFTTLDTGKRWRVSVSQRQHPAILVDVVYSDAFTVVLSKVCTLPDGADSDIYKVIAERNYDLEQLKLSVDRSGDVFASFEVPTRILDRRELMENIVSLAAAMDSIKLDGSGQNAPPDARQPSTPGRGDHAPAVQVIRAPGAGIQARETDL